VWRSEPSRRIFACTTPTDMRKSFQGLLALVQHVFADQDPYSGALFVFVNRKADYVR
jgi:transposase